MIARKYTDILILLLLVPVAFFVYSNSFNKFEILNNKIDVLADCDSASYAILMKDFHLSKIYGNEYNTTNRNLGDIAQKHKIHHFLYVSSGSLLYKLFLNLYRLFGVNDENYALYSINAFITCCNILLLNALLNIIKPNNNKKFVFLVLYAFSLSTWIYASILDSWPFTTMLILIFFILLFKYRCNTVFMSILVGMFMLSNVILGSLATILIISSYANYKNFNSFFVKSVLAIFLAISTWAFSMFILSIYDNSMMPINYFKYTLWFNNFISYKRHFYDLYVLKVVISNLFINSILSNQPNPIVPQEALRYTFETSNFGLIATVVYLLFIGKMFINMFDNSKAIVCDKVRLKILLGEIHVNLLIYGFALALLPLLWFPPASFLYSLTFVPYLIMACYNYFNYNKLLDTVLLYGATIMVVTNNLFQIVKFREVLSKML